MPHQKYNSVVEKPSFRTTLTLVTTKDTNKKPRRDGKKGGDTDPAGLTPTGGR